MPAARTWRRLGTCVPLAGLLAVDVEHAPAKVQLAFAPPFVPFVVRDLVHRRVETGMRVHQRHAVQSPGPKEPNGCHVVALAARQLHEQLSLVHRAGSSGVRALVCPCSAGFAGPEFVQLVVPVERGAIDDDDPVRRARGDVAVVVGLRQRPALDAEDAVIQAVQPSQELRACAGRHRARQRAQDAPALPVFRVGRRGVHDTQHAGVGQAIDSILETDLLAVVIRLHSGNAEDVGIVPQAAAGHPAVLAWNERRPGVAKGRQLEPGQLLFAGRRRGFDALSQRAQRHRTFRFPRRSVAGEERHCERRVGADDGLTHRWPRAGRSS